MVASTGSTTVGTQVTVTVTEKDKYGNVVSGDTVTLTGSTGSKATVTPSPTVTDATGVAVFKVTDTTAQKVTFTAKDTTDLVTLTKPSVTWKPGAPSATKTTVVASAASTAAGTTVSVTVTEKDQYGNLVTGDTVALTKSAGAHATYTPASKATTTGVAKFTVTDTVAEAVTFTAKNTHRRSPSRPPRGHLEARDPTPTRTTVVVPRRQHAGATRRSR